ncbi:hypothetical protein AAMO2058_001733200 [Amorphochlora amoebiformis]
MAQVALNKHSLDPTRTLTWMLSFDQITLLTTLSGMAERQKVIVENEAKDKKDKDEEVLPEYDGINGFLKKVKKGRPTLVYRVESVSLEEGIRLRGAFDRNGVTLHPGYAPNYVLSLESFLKAEGKDFRIFTPEENQRVLRDLKTRLLNITYQSFSETDFSPIQVLPAGIDLFQDYRVVYDTRAKRLNKVLHRDDGIVLFTGVKDRGEFGLWDKTPIEIYTVPHNESTHRIIHMHLNDIRDDVAIDAVNLTGTSKGLNDFKELKKDTSGRLLSYRILVKNAKITNVLHHSGKTADAKFFEIFLPSVGSLVSINSKVLATLLWIPAGMVVSRESDNDVGSRQKSTLPPATFCKCSHKHPVELPGMVDVRLETSPNGELFPEIKNSASGEQKKGERYVSVPICCLRPASSEEVKRLAERRQAVITEAKRELLDTVCELERLIKSAEAPRKAGDPPAPELSDLEKLRVRVMGLSKVKGVEGTIDSTRLARVSRALRFLAFQKRSSKK